ncbi:acyltransferase family protein [Hyphomicrobium sp.]|uniref:acyltransferase family protein n=1 Tax=Hyphomicrobium sp. TaxID=82 RepID=UPI003F6FC211
MTRNSHTQAEHLGYLPHVDGLRAVAVALVVIFHAWPNLLPGGFIGVDVFFVISGFIITRQLAVEMDGGSFSYLAFLGRRIRRLIPAAAVCCILTTMAAMAILMPDAIETFSRSLASVWMMIANVYFYRETGYFDAPAAEAPLLHMWSLAVEDQFYLTWPLLLLLLFKRGWSRPRLIAALAVLAILSLTHSQHATASNPEAAFFLPLSRAFELLAGCALALALPYLKSPARGRWLLDAAGLILVLGSAILLSGKTPFPGLAAVPAVLGSMLLIGAGLSGPTLVSRALSLPPVLLTGKMSYSIYLYHWPVLALATYALGRAPHAGEAGVLVAIALVLAALSWVLVEQKLTGALGLRTMPPFPLIARALAASTALILVALAGIAGDGWPQRLDRPAAEVYRAATSSNPMRQACDGYQAAFSRHSRCTFGAPLTQSGYDIAIFGDSNADHFVPMVAGLAQRAHLAGRQVTQSACAALIGAARARPAIQEEACTRYQETILDFVNRNPNLKVAVLSSSWSSYGTAMTNHLLTPNGPPERRVFAEFARSTVEIFRKRGIKVLIIGQIPHFETFSLNCFATAARSDTEDVDCTIPRAAVDHNLAASQKAFQEIAQADPGVTFLDMVKLLCTEQRCSAFKDDVLVYRDRGHLNAIGSAYLSRYAALPGGKP